MGQNEGLIEVKVVVFNLEVMGLSKDGVSTAFFSKPETRAIK